MKTGRWNLFLYLLLVALAAEVVFLVIQNRNLRARILNLTAQQLPQTLKIGEKVARVGLLSTSGANTQLDFGAGMPNRLIYVFKTSCPACQATLPIWKKLVTAAPISMQIMGIANESVAMITAYQKVNEINYPLFATADTSFKL